MKRFLFTCGVLTMAGALASAADRLPAEVGNLQKGDHMLYCHMNDAGPAWTAYAISKDGIKYHDLLQGDSIFSDKVMAPIEGRTRDAFICRRHDDKGFLMVCTDMEANEAARKRLGKKETWDNYGICLLTSDDLINWKSTSFDYRKGKEIFSDPEAESAYKDWSTINRVWAPQIMWDATYEWPDGRKGGYTDGSIDYVLLLDSVATKEKIIMAMNKVYSKATEDDIVIFFFSGHGFNGGFCAYDGDIHYNDIRKATSKAGFQIDTGSRRGMSREHIAVEVVKEKFKGYVHYISLCKESVNPTTINGQKIKYGVDRMILNHGDIIRLPDAELRFEIPDDDETQLM